MQIPVPRLALAGMLFEIEPFPEFVAGPLNTGSFGPNPLDGTFGPEVVFQKAAPTPNSSPRAGFQFFGGVEIGAQSGSLGVSLRDIDGAVVCSQTPEPWQPA
jgi:alkaline phosphatase D